MNYFGFLIKEMIVGGEEFIFLPKLVYLMGTRFLICIQLDNHYRAAQYGRYDGGLSSQGKEIVQFIMCQMNSSFMENLRTITYISEDSVEPDNTNVYYEGSMFLELIRKQSNLELIDSIDFAYDSLFCDYCYVLNMDNNTLEIYRGMNTTPLQPSDRFYNNGYRRKEYYPVKLLKEYAFKDLKEYFNEI